MARMMTRCLGWAMLGLGLIASLAASQVVEKERETTVTGPRGRTIQRDIKVERGPGFINRQVEVKRPGETIVRDTTIRTGGGGGRSFVPTYAGPRYFGGPRFVENVIVQRPPVVSAVVGLPALGFFFGGGGGGGGPAFGGGGGGGGGGPGGGPPPGPQPPPGFDPFADALGRLKSFHGSSRRDGALTLGRIGDPRAVPALNERLEHDFDKEVRVAAAVALGEIADERGAVALEKAALYDHRNDVREAAKLALKKIPKPGEQLPPQTVPPVPPSTSSKVPPPIPGRPAVLDPGPSPNQNQNVPLEPPLEDIPPPPPVPVPPRSPALEPPSNSGPNRNPS
jgi:HEAT repeats